jgi:zinc protease
MNRSLPLPSLPSAKDTIVAHLPNGITVLARANSHSPSVAISGYLSVGALYDLDEKLGLSDFTSLGLMRGTSQRDFQQIFEALESVGASFGFNGGTHTTGFGGKALAEDLDLLFSILSESLRSPSFPPEQVERLRAQILTHLAIRTQDTTDMASLTFDQIVYADHPYSRPEEGYPETVLEISRADLLDFHQKYYGPRGMVLAVVGAVDPQAVVDQVARHMGSWQNPDQPPEPLLPAPAPLTGRITRRVDIPGKSQSDVILGSAGPQRNDPDFIAAALGNSILGQFGMYGRIGDVVREQHGLAYYAYSSLSGGIGPGPWYINAGAAPGAIDQVVELICQEILRFTSEPVSKEELEDNQANFIGRLPLSMESNGGVAAALINLVRYGLELDYYLKYPDLVRAVTQEDVLRSARRFLDLDRLGIAIAGPNHNQQEPSQHNLAESI